GPRLRERGVTLYVDGTQSVGALRFDVQQVQPAALAVHGYKWLLCPNGCGFLYVRPDVRQWLQPNVIGWRSHHDWRNVDNLYHGRPQPSSRAEKYEGGMPAMPLIYALDASVNLQLELGVEAIERRVMHPRFGVARGSRRRGRHRSGLRLANRHRLLSRRRRLRIMPASRGA
ncbi:MAG: aminotransferase class V-fold PLP-dependent enzyme, partial [Bryobacteraceae bacterium]